ncbi:peptidyl-prolyl cis-trans isomerase [Pontibacter sp. G13]|uniref:peptidylprolyl isomerase n=1 Tax=Pontibacter sp. G13 TaxID=3074898 RepID=UPI00288A612D|nr:peptidyl-prolyl cis-trans isomerase [Pontibacter sp. G13]WNJ21269.1 peptidyl-prolyl cis-trans isomerase [Pontibacter sp. G13]
MSALSKIRHNMALIVTVIFIAMASFVLTDAFQYLSQKFSGPKDAGVVAGEKVTFQEYQDRLTTALNNYGGANELVRGQVSDQVWNQMVSEIAVEKEMESVGLEVTDAELFDMFAGDEIDPLVRPYLLGPDQEYNATQMRQLLSQIQQDPSQAQQLALLEDYASTARGQQRLANMVSAGYISSDLAATQQYNEQMESVNMSFMAVSFNVVPDSLVSGDISDSDLESYIRKNPKRFEQEEEETYISYVSFPLVPSATDSAQAFADLNKKKATFAETGNDSVYSASFSSIPYNGAFRELSDFPEDVQDLLKGASEKEVVGPVLEGNLYKLYKVSGIETADAPSVKVAHILLTFKADTAEVLANAKDLAKQARGSADFATLASENSDDFASRAKGGELGWYPKGRFGEDFDKAVEKASVGSIVGPVKGPGGYHVVKVLDKTSNTYQVASIDKPIYFSSATRDSVFGAANLFAAALNGGNNDIATVATEQGYNAQESNPLNSQTRDVLGLNGGRDLVLWAINADEGEVQEKIPVVNDNKYVVAQVTRKVPAGLRPVEDVRLQVLREVINEKKADLIKSRLSSAAGSDLKSLADAYGEGAIINSANNITFNSSSIPGIGADRLLIGRAFALEAGQTSDPIVGTSGVFVLQVTAKNPAPTIEPATILSNKLGLIAQGKTALQGKVNTAIVENADVQDERAAAEAAAAGY